MKRLVLLLVFFPLLNFAQESDELNKYFKDNCYIEYPSNWILNDSDEDEAIFFLYPNDSESAYIFTENINLIKRPNNSPNISLEKYKSVVEKEINRLLVDNKILHSKIEYQHGLWFHKLIAEGSSDGYKFITVFYSWLLDKDIYTLTFITLHKTYENNRIESLRIMDSFQLNR
ncbi:hypothetical protein [Winogradskyella sp. 3972H.M.0a.05]|uniref:hypothetical protein n=1 Tax=Winogradskyella sp. 3972H.M.0a.05 TaxID=2950277 RepID=UPI00339898E6